MAQRQVYFFIHDENNKYIRAVQMPDGSYVISKNSQPYPLTYNPSNVKDTEMEFATNKSYFSCVRSITNQFDFIKDGAAILRDLYYNYKVTQTKAYLVVVVWNGNTNKYELGYNGKFDLTKKNEDPKAGIFSCPIKDDTAWGVLSEHDDVEYSFDCNASNKKAIPVLIDGINLQNIATYRTIQNPITVFSNLHQAFNVPMVIINQDGDTVNLVLKDNNYIEYTTFLNNEKGGGFLENVGITINVQITGSIEFIWSVNNNRPTGVIIYFQKKNGTAPVHYVYNYVSQGNLVIGKTYNIPFDFTVAMAQGEELFFIAAIANDSSDVPTLNIISTNIQVKTVTKADPQIVYGFRSLDFAKQLVARATQNRYSINSNFFAENNKDVILSGDSLRNVPSAKISTTFKDFFAWADSTYFTALRTISGELWIEKAIEVYKNSGNIIDLKDIIDLKLSSASDILVSQIECGSPVVDMRHPSGRLEFNSTNKWSLPLLDVKNKMSKISPYHMGCFEIMFLILDYLGSSTKDNSGDNKVYVVKITDEIGYAQDLIENFQETNVDSTILEPIIKSPLNNDTIGYNKPIIRGIAPAGSNVNIYSDGSLDGNTTADSNGNWSYPLVGALTVFVDGVSTGIHVIQASYTDLIAPHSTINVLIDTRVAVENQIVTPGINESLLNNLPLVKGVGQRGNTINLELDGVVIATLTCDDSCKWEYKFTTPITNGTHILSINGGLDPSTIIVDSFTTYPIITYIDSELDGFPIINNLPLIKGVGTPGEVITLWLNYIAYASLGSTTVDANGNWQFQVIPVTYLDPVTFVPVVLAPIPNGLNIFSTSLDIHTVSINVYGYKLSRPAYSSITGVLDNTVFNTEYSPSRMLESQYPLLASMYKNNLAENIYFESADKNGALVTILNGVTKRENAHIPASTLGEPLMLLERGLIKTKANDTFAKTLYNFSNGGLVKASFRGNDLYFLPMGSMKIKNITSDVQEWSLIMSPLVSYQTLLNLFKNGLTIKLMRNSVHHSDYNTLHFVTYDYQRPAKYKSIEIYDERFSERNEAWLYNPDYIQKIETGDPVIVDQIINNGLINLKLDVYRCIDGLLQASIPYVAVTPAPVMLPDVVLEATLDPSSLEEGQYFTVISSDGLPLAISEPFEIRDSWPGTILIEASNSLNKVNFFFSTGNVPMMRVEGLVKKLQPSIQSIVAEEESGDTELLYSLNTRDRVVRFGTAYGLPDYIYLRVADYISLDNYTIEGVAYAIQTKDNITPSDDVDGHPLYYYNVRLSLKENVNGKTFGGPVDANVNSVVLVVDANAFGIPTDAVISISLDNE